MFPSEESCCIFLLLCLSSNELYITFCYNVRIIIFNGIVLNKIKISMETKTKDILATSRNTSKNKAIKSVYGTYNVYLRGGICECHMAQSDGKG